ncbi:MAG: ribosome silencing factor [Bacteroidota bacterium]|nr:ribosome silencing factor [Bacteroidota bacterium]
MTFLSGSVEAEETVRVIKDALLEKKAVEIKIIDLRELDGATFDFFVIAHGTSDVHVGAVADNVAEKTAEILSVKPSHIEGKQNNEWVLLDYFDVVVHVFKEETRRFFNIESLWADADIKIVDED